jgi:oligoribonuclease (3'-5' exoribonuclease)
MSKADIELVRSKIAELTERMQAIVKEGTSKGENRKKYKDLRRRITTLNKWKKELETKNKKRC